MSDKPNDFVLVESPAEALGLLKEAAKTISSCFVWTRNQDQNIKSHINVFSDTDRAFYIWSPKDFDAEKFMDELARLNQKECFFSVSLTRANIFFKARFITIDKGGIKFQFPEKVFKVQRRKDMRLPIPDGYVIKVEFQDPLMPEQMLSRKALDISAGGLAILVAPEEKPVFQVDSRIEKLSFTVRSRKISCNAEVRHVRDMPPGSRTPGVKVGFLFTGLREADSQHIASYVFEESRKYYSRFL